MFFVNSSTFFVIFQVELILNHKKVGKTYEYFVHWLGYPPSDDSWVPAQNMVRFTQP